MASVGLDTGGSQFYISLNENPQLNGRCVAFGRIVEGMNLFANIEKVIEIIVLLSRLLMLFFSPSDLYIPQCSYH